MVSYKTFYNWIWTGFGQTDKNEKRNMIDMMALKSVEIEIEKKYKEDSPNKIRFGVNDLYNCF